MERSLSRMQSQDTGSSGRWLSRRALHHDCTVHGELQSRQSRVEPGFLEVVATSVALSSSSVAVRLVHLRLRPRRIPTVSVNEMQGQIHGRRGELQGRDVHVGAAWRERKSSRTHTEQIQQVADKKWTVEDVRLVTHGPAAQCRTGSRAVVSETM